MSAKLTLDDILDLRAYEREREAFRAHIIALKQRRRVLVGPIVSVVFENRETMRFQVQEMARAERMLADAQIQAELDVYNPLVPERGELSATLFIELGTRAELMEWLPRLVGVERSVELRIGQGERVEVVRATPEEAHEAQLTREAITASVHYVRFRLAEAQVQRFAAEPVALAVNHPSYQHQTLLSEATRAELLQDLHG
ncbi:MAG: DUF3501 family protein [Chloroflexi bacterium]|nr:DUF3501 family protein [Chloroflexota bacterium]